jgi:hypothetical protein
MVLIGYGGGSAAQEEAFEPAEVAKNSINNETAAHELSHILSSICVVDGRTALSRPLVRTQLQLKPSSAWMPI